MRKWIIYIEENQQITLIDVLNALYVPHENPMRGVKNSLFTVEKAHVQRARVIFPMPHDWQRAELDEKVFIIIY